jgi:dienelactone hydrolase
MLAVVLLLTSCDSSADPDEIIVPGWTRAALQELFAVDPDAPAGYETLGVTEANGGVEVRDITFTGADGNDVRAFLVIPPGDGPFAGVVWMHWGGGSRSSFSAEAVAAAAHGVVSVLVDRPFRQDVDYFTEVIADLRLATNLLVSLPNVDADRLGYVGHSWGATLGGILAAIDRRFETYILMAGVSAFTEHFDDEAFLPLDGGAYIGDAAPASLFFQGAENDGFVSREMVEAYYEAASEPKTITWYKTTHIFNDKASRADRLAWLIEELELG